MKKAFLQARDSPSLHILLLESIVLVCKENYRHNFQYHVKVTIFLSLSSSGSTAITAIQASLTYYREMTTLVGKSKVSSAQQTKTTVSKELRFQKQEEINAVPEYIKFFRFVVLKKSLKGTSVLFEFAQNLKRYNMLLMHL